MYKLKKGGVDYLYKSWKINVYECNGTNIFMSWKIKRSIQLGFASFNATFNEWKYCSIARMKKKKPNKQTLIHYLFYITAKLIFYSKTKLPMFSQIHLL